MQGFKEVAEHALPSLDPGWPAVPGCHITAEIAAGGMAVLYRGHFLSKNREVAIKALRTDVMAELAAPGYKGPDWRQRFIREARILAGLSHENLVAVYELVEAESGGLFIIMELCEGADLLDVLSQKAGEGLPFLTAAHIALGTARALSHIHAHGFVHRDVKPANILLPTQGGVKLIDFGTAWDPENVRDKTGFEVGLGTPSYMSPEQALGQPLDARSDQFGLGVVIYQMLTGQKPFVETDGLPAALLEQVVRTEPPPLFTLKPDLPPGLYRIVERCLKKNAKQRYANTLELVEAIETLIFTHSRPEPLFSRVRRRIRL